MSAPARPLPYPIPARAGIGLRAPHYREVVATAPATGWFEVHSENFFGAGGQPLHFLEAVRARYPVSLHGVGMSLGSCDPLNTEHLARLKALIARIEPALVSEHLCFCSIDGRHANDLLPLPYTDEALAHVAARVSAVQDFLGRPILIENVSSYVQFKDSTIPEWEFMTRLSRAGGCGILLDVNNIHVSGTNHGFDARAYIDAIPRGAVGEIHLAGFEGAGDFLIDTHGAPVAEPVWGLYRYALARFGRVPTLIERDANIPPLCDLLAEAARADAYLEQADARVA